MGLLNAMTPLDQDAIFHAVLVGTGSLLCGQIHGPILIHISERRALEEINQGGRNHKQGLEDKQRMEVPSNRPPSISETVEENEHGEFDQGQDGVVEHLICKIVLLTQDRLFDAQGWDIVDVITLPGQKSICGEMSALPSECCR